MKLQLAIHITIFTNQGRQNEFTIKNNLPPENFRENGISVPMQVLDLEVGQYKLTNLVDHPVLFEVY